MIVDLGAVHTGTIEHVAQHALHSLHEIRRGFPDVVSVSLLFKGVRVGAWPDDSVRSVRERWHEAAEEERAQQEEDRKHADPGYVGKHRA